MFSHHWLAFTDFHTHSCAGDRRANVRGGEKGSLLPKQATLSLLSIVHNRGLTLETRKRAFFSAIVSSDCRR